MIYANSNTKEMYVFDKDGEWHDDGVYHDALNMDATYNETRWYDEFNPHNFMWKAKKKRKRKSGVKKAIGSS